MNINIISKLTSRFTRMADEYRQLDSKGKRRWWADFILRNALYIIIFIVVVYVQIYSIRSPRRLTRR